MLFYLTTLNLAKFLYEDAPSLKENEKDRQVVAVVVAWKHADFLCKNYIYNLLLIWLIMYIQRLLAIAWIDILKQLNQQLKISKEKQIQENIKCVIKRENQSSKRKTLLRN